METTMPARVLKALAHPMNQAILTLLRNEPSYPRRIAALLDMSETEVSRRVRHLQTLGLVRGDWATLEGRNVKAYQVTFDVAHVRLGGDGVHLRLEGAEARTAHVDPMPSALPRPGSCQGFEQHLERLATAAPVVLVEGVVGSGKTTLLAAHAATLPEGTPVLWHGMRGVESVRWLANRLAAVLAHHGHPELLGRIEAGLEDADLPAAVLDALDTPNLVTILDDLHNLEDPALKDLLRDATERTRNGQLILAGRSTLVTAAGRPDATHVHLDGLPDDALRAIFEEEGVRLPPRLLPRVRAETGGHPLATRLLARAALDHDGDVEPLLDLVPEGPLEEYLLQEVHDHLAPDERVILAYASLFEGPFRTEDLQEIAPRDPRGPLVRLRRAGLVTNAGDLLVVQPAVRHFFRGHLSAPHDVHRQLARKRLEDGSPEARIEALHHALQAEDRGLLLMMLEDDLSLEEHDLIAAGHQGLYLQCLDLLDRDHVKDDTLWARVLDERGDIRLSRGETDLAQDHYRKGLAVLEGSTRATARRLRHELEAKLALCLHQGGEGHEARRITERLLGGPAVDDLPDGMVEALQEVLADASSPNPAT